MEHFALDILIQRNVDEKTGEKSWEPTKTALDYRSYFKEIMIDEYQDSNEVQDAIFSALTSQRQNCFMVGDVKQSIYRWRGGDWRILKEMVQHRLGKDNIHTENLKANWRSLDQVVKFNNTAIGKVVTATNNQLNNELYQATQQGFLSDETYHQLHDTLIKAYEGYEQVAKSKNLAPGYVRVERYDEQPRIIDIINDVISRGYTYNDIMILHRNSDEVARTTTQLLEHKWLTNAPGVAHHRQLSHSKLHHCPNAFVAKH